MIASRSVSFASLVTAGSVAAAMIASRSSVPPAVLPVIAPAPAVRPPPTAAPDDCPAHLNDDLTGLSRDEQQLARLWRAHDPCADFPTDRDHRDRLAVLRANVDDSPGIEWVIAENRFGIAMLAADGTTLAYTADDSVGCCGWDDENDPVTITLSARQLISANHRQLIVRTRRINTNGEFKDAYAFERRGTKLEHIVHITEFGKQGSDDETAGVWGVNLTARTTVPRLGELEVHYDGTVRNWDSITHIDRPWLPDHEVCTLRVGADGKFAPVDQASRTLCPDTAD